MKAFIFLFLATIVSALTIDSIPVGAEVIEAPFTTRLNKRWAKDKWGNNPEPHRRKVTIRASKNDYDDVSNDFLWAMKKANHGGLVHLEESKTYVIGKRLDLSWLDDIYVRLDGEIKVFEAKSEYVPLDVTSNEAVHVLANSSQTISLTSKPITSITHSKNPLRSRCGAAKISRFMEAEL